MTLTNWRSLEPEVNAAPAALHLRVLARVVAGENYREIAAAEYISSRTVRRLVKDLKGRTGTDNLAALGAEAVRRGWLAG
jgi:DNA-binding CsgD family transcriptional regulator